MLPKKKPHVAGGEVMWGRLKEILHRVRSCLRSWEDVNMEGETSGLGGLLARAVAMAIETPCKLYRKFVLFSPCLSPFFWPPL